MIFRYPGGKSKASVRNWILDNAPSKFDSYREPMVGGGGIFFSVLCRHRWINDIHPGLIAVYTALRDRPEEFIQKCRAIKPALAGEKLTPTGPRGGRGKNARLAALFDQFKDDTGMDQALRYFFINRTVFAGRVNYDITSRLYFSEPAGWNIVKTNALERAANHLQRVRVTQGSYAQLLSAPGKMVWVYLDPPYVVNTNMPATDQLYQHGFSMADHLTLRDKVAACSHNVSISYDDDAEGFIRDIYRDFRVLERKWAYSGTTLTEKKQGRELLIMNY